MDNLQLENATDKLWESVPIVEFYPNTSSLNAKSLNQAISKEVAAQEAGS